MKITVLAENTSSRGLPAEHGLSLFVEGTCWRFLFDMGQTDLFSRNARTLGIDLDSADLAVLSHGHYDHGGGLGTFLKLNSHAPVYMSPYAFEPHYNGTEKYIGLDARLSGSDRIVFAGDEKKIAPGLTLYGCRGVSGKTDFGPSGLNMIRDGKMAEEDFRHEVYLMAEENGKRILFSGCSHRGVLNIMRRFRPDIFIGGLHLSKFPLDGTLAACAGALDAFHAKFFAGHCTGEEQVRFMKNYMKDLTSFGTGDRIEI